MNTTPTNMTASEDMDYCWDCDTDFPCGGECVCHQPEEYPNPLPAFYFWNPATAKKLGL